MLDFFRVSHATDGGTICRIFVEPAKRQCFATVTLDGLIVKTADESEASFRSVTASEWADPRFWSGRAAHIARAHSPFWNPVEAA